MKRCRACRQNKPLTSYGPSHKSRDGHRSTCKACDVHSRRLQGGPTTGEPRPTKQTFKPRTWLDKYQTTL